MLTKLSAKTALVAAIAAAGLTAGAASASAEDRKLAVSYTVGGTSDYVFRGITQTRNDPAFQAAIDATYGIAYAGIWGSNVDFSAGGPETAEIDFYAGIKPVWKSFLGEVTFDFGVIYYVYPNATSAFNYVELKGGYSVPSPWIKNLTTGTTLYYSNDYNGSAGDTLTVESNAAYVLPSVGIFAPTLSGTYGTVYGSTSQGFTTNAAGTDDQYDYWNAGVSLAVEKFTFDFRYWDSNAEAGSFICAASSFCDERFVFSAKVVLP